MEERIGWKCPTCKSTYSPDIKVCKECQKNEETTTGPDLLLET